jgi:hypothetical protein
MVIFLMLLAWYSVAIGLALIWIILLLARKHQFVIVVELNTSRRNMGRSAHSPARIEASRREPIKRLIQHRDPKSPIANPGATGPGQCAWGVYTAGPPGRRYALAGDYAGLGAGFACGPGLSANALGGNGNSISLQPLSLGPSTGLNLSAGVGSLSLQPVVAEPPRRYRSPSVRNSTKRK